MEKVAAVFGGGARVTDTKEYLDTVAIGRILAENGYWVKCGGYYGIMEAVSKGVSEVGGTVSGITCKTFPSAVGNKYLTETIVADDIYDRLRYLINGTQLFIVQRGGLGTLSELFLALDIIRKIKKDKPKVILVGACMFHLIAEVQKLCNDNELNSLFFIDSVDGLKQHLCQEE